MAKKVPLVSVGVKRDGITVFPKIGEPFEFTDAELKDLTKLSKETKVDYFRAPVNEGGDTKTDGKAGKGKAPATSEGGNEGGDKGGDAGNNEGGNKDADL